MMSGEIHELSNAIGRLQENAEHARRSREQHHLAVTAMGRQLTELAGEVRIALHDMKEMRDAIAPLQVEIDLWRNLRNRAIGMMTVAAVVVSAAGAAAYEVMKAMLR